MSEKRSSFLLVYDIYQSIEKIEEFIRGISFNQLMTDERTKDAILLKSSGHKAKHRKIFRNP